MEEMKNVKNKLNTLIGKQLNNMVVESVGNRETLIVSYPVNLKCKKCGRVIELDSKFVCRHLNIETGEDNVKTFDDTMDFYEVDELLKCTCKE